MELSQAAKERMLILDGAVGTMIRDYKLSEEDFAEAVCGISFRCEGQQ